MHTPRFWSLVRGKRIKDGIPDNDNSFPSHETSFWALILQRPDSGGKNDHEGTYSEALETTQDVRGWMARSATLEVGVPASREAQRMPCRQCEKLQCCMLPRSNDVDDFCLFISNPNSGNGIASMVRAISPSEQQPARLQREISFEIGCEISTLDSSFLSITMMTRCGSNGWPLRERAYYVRSTTYLFVPSRVPPWHV